MRNIILSVFIFFGIHLIAQEQGGMWLPNLLEKINEHEMIDLGMKISAKDIYNFNQSSIKDAIVHFNGGCTSSIISGEGLLLTNHHCGYRQIQYHSTIKNDYLKNGYWAKMRKNELPNPNLKVTFIKGIYEVTNKVLKSIPDTISEKNRQKIISTNINNLKSSWNINKYEKLIIKSFFAGNKYYIFVTETYKDIRLVGAPPSSIGKYGSDTDNWMWPRHTGDFSLFRIYADKNNNPAEYSVDNIPYKPKHFLPISIDGVEEGDFTLVYGFPGTTKEYLPAVAVDKIVNVYNPIKINIRKKALAILDKEMRKDDWVRIKYASKYASIANYYKKWIGERTGILKTKGIGKKKNFEKEFLRKNTNADYNNILIEFEKLYAQIEPLQIAKDYFYEVAYTNVEIMKLCYKFSRLKKLYEAENFEKFDKEKEKLILYAKRHFKDYDLKADKKVFRVLFEMYFNEFPKELLSEELKDFVEDYDNNFDNLTNDIFEKTIFSSHEKLEKFFKDIEEAEDLVDELQDDLAFKLSHILTNTYKNKVIPQYNKINNQISLLQRIYMKAQMELFPNRKFFPDANSSLRVTYGQVKGYAPNKNTIYTPKTYLKGVIEKYKPNDYEFDLPKKLIDLYEKKDYGIYADKNGKMPVNFIGTNHTTGGNSGSPVMDAYGNLIGLNFDRVWEGTMSDINYDASICRNIMVDARYILFIIDKFANAKYLIDELKFVHPKEKY